MATRRALYQGLINNWLKLRVTHAMDASQLFGTIIRILNQPVFPPRTKPAHAGKMRPAHGRPHLSTGAAAQAAARPEAAKPAVPTGLVPIVVEPMAAPGPAATTARATTQAMRTLEEVRADLARLRDQAKRRHAAHVQERRDRAFAPTDFMEYGKLASPAAPAAAREFAPTDFMDMGIGKPS